MRLNIDIKIIWSNEWLIEEDLYVPNEPELEESTRGLYVIYTDDGEICYIGQTYDQTFRDRIMQHRNDEVGNCLREILEEDYDLFLKVGHFELISYSRISRELLDDTERLFIYALEPTCNILGIKSFTGRDLLVKNIRARDILPRYLWSLWINGYWEIDYSDYKEDIPEAFWLEEED